MVVPVHYPQTESELNNVGDDLEEGCREDNGNIENSSASLGKTRISRDFLFATSSGPGQPVMLALKGHANLLKGYLQQASHWGHVFFPVTRRTAT